jgi:hypothetical protein
MHMSGKRNRLSPGLACCPTAGVLVIEARTSKHQKWCLDHIMTMQQLLHEKLHLTVFVMSACRSSKRKMPESQEPWADMTQDSGDEGNSDDSTPPSPGELLRQHKQRTAAARNKRTAMPAPSVSHRPVASQQQQQKPTVTGNQGRGRFQTMTMSVHSGAVR